MWKIEIVQTEICNNNRNIIVIMLCYLRKTVQIKVEM